MDTVYMICLGCIAVFSITGILSRYFDDNLCQRIGLSLIGFASTIEIWMSFSSMLCYQLENIRQIFVVGAVVYAIGTAKKVYQYRHHA